MRFTLAISLKKFLNKESLKTSWSPPGLVICSVQVITFLSLPLILEQRLEVVTFFTKLREYKVSYLDNTYDSVSPDDFDCVDVILEQL